MVALAGVQQANFPGHHPGAHASTRPAGATAYNAPQPGSGGVNWQQMTRPPAHLSATDAKRFQALRSEFLKLVPRYQEHAQVLQEAKDKVGDEPPSDKPSPELMAFWKADAQHNKTATDLVHHDAMLQDLYEGRGTKNPSARTKEAGAAFKTASRQLEDIENGKLPQPEPQQPPKASEEDIGRVTGDIHEAVSGGVFGLGTDEDKLWRALEGEDGVPKTKEAWDEIRASYKKHHGGDLDDDIVSDLEDPDDKKRAKALLKGIDDPEGVAEAAAAKISRLRRDLKGADIVAQLREATLEERKAIREGYRRLYDTDMLEALDSPDGHAPALTDDDLKEAKALFDPDSAESQKTLAESVARRVHGDLDFGFAWTDWGKEIDVSGLQKNLKGWESPEKLAQVRKAYRDLYGKNLEDDLKAAAGDDNQRTRALLLVEGQTQGNEADRKAKLDALELRSIGDDGEALREKLEELGPQAVAEARRVDEDLAQALSSKIDDTDERSEIEMLLSDPRHRAPAPGASPQEAQAWHDEVKQWEADYGARRAHRALDGLNDEDLLRHIFKSSDGGQVDRMLASYKQIYGRDLREHLKDELGDRDEHEIVGIHIDRRDKLTTRAPQTEGEWKALLTEEVDRLERLQKHEGDSDFASFMQKVGHLDMDYRTDAERLRGAVKDARAAIERGDLETAARLVGLGKGDIEALVGTKRSASEGAAMAVGTVAAVAASAAVIVASGGTATGLVVGAWAAGAGALGSGGTYYLTNSQAGATEAFRQGGIGAVSAIPFGGRAVTLAAQQAGGRVMTAQLARTSAWAGTQGGALSGGLMTGTDQHTWDQGLATGALHTLYGAGAGAVAGAVLAPTTHAAIGGVRSVISGRGGNLAGNTHTAAANADGPSPGAVPAVAAVAAAGSADEAAVDAASSAATSTTNVTTTGTNATTNATTDATTDAATGASSNVAGNPAGGAAPTGTPEVINTAATQNTGANTTTDAAADAATGTSSSTGSTPAGNGTTNPEAAGNSPTSAAASPDEGSAPTETGTTERRSGPRSASDRASPAITTARLASEEPAAVTPAGVARTANVSGSRGTDALAAIKTPAEEYPKLFSFVQLHGKGPREAGALYPDSKTFVDATPRPGHTPARINSEFDALLRRADGQPSPDQLRQFVDDHFDLSKPKADTDGPLTVEAIEDHLDRMWGELERPANPSPRPGSSDLPLRFRVIVPAMRFLEAYNWDMLPTVKGLLASAQRLGRDAHKLDLRARALEREAGAFETQAVRHRELMDEVARLESTAADRRSKLTAGSAKESEARQRLRQLEDRLAEGPAPAGLRRQAPHDRATLKEQDALRLEAKALDDLAQQTRTKAQALEQPATRHKELVDEARTLREDAAGRRTRAENRQSLVRGIVQNFSDAIDAYGFVPNGFRTYYVKTPGRAQPEVFAELVDIVSKELKDPELLSFYLPQMVKAYDYWMNPAAAAHLQPGQAHGRVVRLPDGPNGEKLYLPRYHGGREGTSFAPRQESFVEDIEVAAHAVAAKTGVNEHKAVMLLKDIYTKHPGHRGITDIVSEDAAIRQRIADITDMEPDDFAKLVNSRFQNMHAGAESGWDYSALRWAQDGKSLHTLNVTDLVPVDNATWAAYTLPKKIAEGFRQQGNLEQAWKYEKLADDGALAIRTHLWNPQRRRFEDYNFVTGSTTDRATAAMVMPVRAGIASPEQANGVASNISGTRWRFWRADGLLRRGGLATTMKNDGRLHTPEQQWDYKNGWAPNNTYAIEGQMVAAQQELSAAALQSGRGWPLSTIDSVRAALRARKHMKLAQEIGGNFEGTLVKVHQDTGKLWEKYDVVRRAKGGGGEYEMPSGFGWTNGFLDWWLEKKVQMSLGQATRWNPLDLIKNPRTPLVAMSATYGTYASKTNAAVNTLAFDPHAVFVRTMWDAVIERKLGKLQHLVDRATAAGTSQAERQTREHALNQLESWLKRRGNWWGMTDEGRYSQLMAIQHLRFNPRSPEAAAALNELPGLLMRRGTWQESARGSVAGSTLGVNLANGQAVARARGFGEMDSGRILNWGWFGTVNVTYSAAEALSALGAQFKGRMGKAYHHLVASPRFFIAAYFAGPQLTADLAQGRLGAAAFDAAASLTAALEYRRQLRIGAGLEAKRSWAPPLMFMGAAVSGRMAIEMFKLDPPKEPSQPATYASYTVLQPPSGARRPTDAEPPVVDESPVPGESPTPGPQPSAEATPPNEGSRVGAEPKPEDASDAAQPDRDELYVKVDKRKADTLLLQRIADAALKEGRLLDETQRAQAKQRGGPEQVRRDALRELIQISEGKERQFDLALLGGGANDGPGDPDHLEHGWRIFVGGRKVQG